MALGMTIMLWAIGPILSFLIFSKTLSLGFLIAVISLISDMGIQMVLLPFIVTKVPKFCANDMAKYATISVQLAFYLLLSSLDPYTTSQGRVIMYIVGYNLTYLATTTGVSYATCN